MVHDERRRPTSLLTVNFFQTPLVLSDNVCLFVAVNRGIALYVASHKPTMHFSHRKGMFLDRPAVTGRDLTGTFQTISVK